MGWEVLQILRAHLRKLMLSKINPQDVIPRDGELKGAHALEQLLQRTVDDVSLPIRVRNLAAETIQMAESLLVPSPHARRFRAVELANKCRVIELQIPWPAVRTNTCDSVDEVDIRFERLILILQLFCRKHGMRHKFTGRFMGLAHLVLEVPAKCQTLTLLVCDICNCLRRAGFQDWQFPAGSARMLVQSRLFVEWDRQRELQHGGVGATQGILRLYCGDFLPGDSFDQICTSINADQH